MSIALITTREDELAEFKNGLEEHGGLEVLAFTTGSAAVDAASKGVFVLAVVDENLPDLTPLDAVMGLMRVNAMINTVVISSMDKKEFHDKSEGLGILTQLTPLPGADDAKEVVRILGVVNNLNPS